MRRSVAGPSILQMALLPRSVAATVERRRVLVDAGAYLADHPALRDGYVTHVSPVADVQAAFTAAIAPRPGQLKIAVDMA